MQLSIGIVGCPYRVSRDSERVYVAELTRPLTESPDLHGQSAIGCKDQDLPITWLREEQLSRSINRTKERCLKNSLAMSRGMDFLLYEILDGTVDNYFPILDDFDEVVNELEHEVIHNPSKETLNRIFSLKRDGMALRRVTGPQREILNRLSRDPFAVINKRTAIYFRDVYDHLVRISELAESYKDLTTGLLEAYLSVVSNRLNEIMKVLTVFTAVMMPLTVITGLYGMNFKYMPELDWPYGYHMTIGIMAVVIVGMLGFFRWKKWL